MSEVLIINLISNVVLSQHREPDVSTADTKVCCLYSSLVDIFTLFYGIKAELDHVSRARSEARTMKMTTNGVNSMQDCRRMHVPSSCTKQRWLDQCSI